MPYMRRPQDKHALKQYLQAEAEAEVQAEEECHGRMWQDLVLLQDSQASLSLLPLFLLLVLLQQQPYLLQQQPHLLLF